MEIKEIQEFLNTNKENEEVKGLIKSFQQPIDRDTVEEWCKDGDGRSWLDRNCDIYSSKAIETARTNALEKFKTEELPKLLEEEKKKLSNQGLTPEQIQLQELQNQINALKEEKERAEMLNKNIQTLKDKNLPIELAEYINGEEDLTKFETILNAAIQKGINEKLGDHSETPPTTGGGTKKMTLPEIMDYASKNPGADIDKLIKENL